MREGGVKKAVVGRRPGPRNLFYVFRPVYSHYERVTPDLEVH